MLPIEAEARRKATAAKRQLGEAAGGASDHLALVRASLTQPTLPGLLRGPLPLFVLEAVQ